MDIQAVDSASVAVQHHHTPVCLQVPAPTGVMKQQINTHYSVVISVLAPAPASSSSSSSSPDTRIAAGGYQQASVLTQQHCPDAANMALHRRHGFGFRRHVEQVRHAVLGARGHQRSTSVVHRPVRVFSAKHNQPASVMFLLQHAGVSEAQK